MRFNQWGNAQNWTVGLNHKCCLNKYAKHLLLGGEQKNYKISKGQQYYLFYKNVLYCNRGGTLKIFNLIFYNPADIFIICVHVREVRQTDHQGILLWGKDLPRVPRLPGTPKHLTKAKVLLIKLLFLIHKPNYQSSLFFVPNGLVHLFDSRIRNKLLGEIVTKIKWQLHSVF